MAERVKIQHAMSSRVISVGDNSNMLKNRVDTTVECTKIFAVSESIHVVSSGNIESRSSLVTTSTRYLVVSMFETL